MTFWIIARKELTEALRDRRSLSSGLLYGIWGPLAMALAVTAIARDRAIDDRLSIVAEQHALAPALVGFLEARGVTVEEADDVRARVRRREAPVALAIDSGYREDFQAARPARLTVIYHGAWSASRARAERVRAAVRDYAREVGDTRLILRGIAPSVVSAIDLDEEDLSTAADRAAAVVSTLPIFVLLAAFIGGMSVAADVTAGERERHSLESLLLYPVPRRALAAGKWLAAAALATATVSMTIGMAAAILRHPRIQAVDLPVGLSMAEAGRVWALLLPLALLAPALQLLIGLLSRTFKEANTHLSLLMFVPMIPGFLFAFGTLQPQPWMARTPVLGQHLLVSAVLRGEAIATGDVAWLVGLSLAGTATAIALTAWLLDRESAVARA